MKKEDLISFLEEKSIDATDAHLMAWVKERRPELNFPAFDYFFLSEIDSKLIGWIITKELPMEADDAQVDYDSFRMTYHDSWKEAAMKGFPESTWESWEAVPDMVEKGGFGSLKKFA